MIECRPKVVSLSAVKLGNKERFDKEKIGIKEPFPVTNLTFTHRGKEKREFY